MTAMADVRRARTIRRGARAVQRAQSWILTHRADVAATLLGRDATKRPCRRRCGQSVRARLSTGTVNAGWAYR
jgi:hypothetical protein